MKNNLAKIISKLFAEPTSNWIYMTWVIGRSDISWAAKTPKFGEVNWVLL